MQDAPEEAKAALVKSKDDMAKYYDRKQTPAPDYKPGDKSTWMLATYKLTDLQGNYPTGD